MSGRRLGSIIHAISINGRWAGRIAGRRLLLEKCPCESSGHVIHWHVRRAGKASGGWARTVKDAIDFCEREAAG